MYQPEVTNRIRVSIGRRVEGIRRSLSNNPPLPELYDQQNIVSNIRAHVESLESHLPQDVWRPLIQSSESLVNEVETLLMIHNNDDASEDDEDDEEYNDDDDDDDDDRNTESTPRNRRGRPVKGIDRQKLQTLLNMGFSLTRIADENLLGLSVHRNTILNFMKRNNMGGVRAKFSTISTADLATIIRELSERYPNSGYREIRAMLASRDPPIIVQRKRVQELLKQVDPAGTARRWALSINRRTYSVPTANYLWHIDTHHKLIRWNFVTYGCIDGKSRLVVSLNVATNNYAITALHNFFDSVVEYAVPGKVRVDGGSEFNHVERFMNELDGSKRCIRGKSVHNQRIERLWRDVYNKVIVIYQGLFNHMENRHILSIENDIQMFALHTVFVPRLRADLNVWKNSWNTHPLRTQSNMTPMQIWNSDIITNANSSYSSIQNILLTDAPSRVAQVNRFSQQHQLQEPDDIEIVLSRIPNPLTDAQLQ